MSLILFKCKNCGFKRYALLGGQNVRGENAEVILKHFTKNDHTLLLGPGEIEYKYNGENKMVMK